MSKHKGPVWAKKRIAVQLDIPSRDLYGEPLPTVVKFLNKLIAEHPDKPDLTIEFDELYGALFYYTREETDNELAARRQQYEAQQAQRERQQVIEAQRIKDMAEYNRLSAKLGIRR